MAVAAAEGGGPGPVFCSTLPFSTLGHHWWHVKPLKLLANRLSSFALSPRIIGVKGRRASQLMSRRAPRSPKSSHSGARGGRSCSPTLRGDRVDAPRHLGPCDNTKNVSRQEAGRGRCRVARCELPASPWW